MSRPHHTPTPEHQSQHHRREEGVHATLDPTLEEGRGSRHHQEFGERQEVGGFPVNLTRGSTRAHTTGRRGVCQEGSNPHDQIRDLQERNRVDNIESPQLKLQEGGKEMQLHHLHTHPRPHRRQHPPPHQSPHHREEGVLQEGSNPHDQTRPHRKEEGGRFPVNLEPTPQEGRGSRHQRKEGEFFFRKEQPADYRGEGSLDHCGGGGRGARDHIYTEM